MNKIVLSLGLLLLVSSCGDGPLAWEGEVKYDPYDNDDKHYLLDIDGGINDCNGVDSSYVEQGYYYLDGPENYCCCNTDATNYSEEGWNCNPEDDTYCIFD